MSRTTEGAARLERLVTDHGQAVLGYLVRRCQVAEDAADVYQRVLVVAWRRIDRVPDHAEAARCWLLAVARRELANASRGERRRSAAVSALAAELAVRAAPDGGPGDEVRVALEALSADDRELLLLVYWDGLTAEQAAVVLGVRPAAARKRLQRARERLARHPLVAGSSSTVGA